MAHFYGRLQGSRGEATRCGTKNSGIWGCVRSWDNEITAEIYADEQTEEDVARVSIPEDMDCHINGIKFTPKLWEMLKSDKLKDIMMVAEI